VDLLKYFFLLTLLIFPTGQVLRLQLSSNINISLFDVSVVLVALVWFVSILSGNKKYRQYRLSTPILFFFLTMLLSWVPNFFRYELHETGTALLYAFRWLSLVSLYFVVKELPEGLTKKIPLLLTGSGAVLLVLGYVQYFLYPNLRNLYYLGWDEHLVRMFSSFLDPNFAGAFFVLYFLFVMGRLMEKDRHSGFVQNLLGSPKRDSGVVVPPPRNDGKLEQWILAILALFTFIAIFLTTSRSAFIMLAVGLITYLVLIGKKKWIFSFIGITALIFLFSSRFFYIENINPLRVTSSLARLESASNALQIVSRNPIFGVGFNAYRYAQQEYGFRSKETEYPNHADSGTDNSFLFIFATTGIIGFVAFITLLYRVFGLGIERQQTISGKILIASLLGLCVNSLFINSLFYPALFFWLILLISLTDYN
jgi:O-antigen ligase